MSDPLELETCELADVMWTPGAGQAVSIQLQSISPPVIMHFNYYE